MKWPQKLLPSIFTPKITWSEYYCCSSTLAVFGGYGQEFGHKFVKRRLKLGHEIWTWTRTQTRENSKPRTWIWTWIQTCVSAELWCRTAFDFRTIWVTCVNPLLTMSTYCYTINDSVTIKCYKCILLNSHFRSTSFLNRSTNFEISYVSMKKLVPPRGSTRRHGFRPPRTLTVYSSTSTSSN